MRWSQEAEAALSGVPSFVRGMAKKAVEDEARKRGIEEITPALVQDVKDKYFTSLFGSKAGKAKETKSAGHARKEDGCTECGEDQPVAEAAERKGRKIAIIRCEITSETCPGIACMMAWNKRRIHFEGYGPEDELIAMLTCGGCSGRRVARMVEKLKKYGLDTVHLSSCMMLEGDYPECPHLDAIKQSIAAKGVAIVEGTHH